METLGIGVVFILALYLLPTIIVLCNKKNTNKAPTIIVNVLLGLTIIGWVIALAMSLSDSHKVSQISVSYNNTTNNNHKRNDARKESNKNSDYNDEDD